MTSPNSDHHNPTSSDQPTPTPSTRPPTSDHDYTTSSPNSRQTTAKTVPTGVHDVPTNAGRAKKHRRRKARAGVRQLKVGLLNAQGKIGRYRNDTWQDLQNIVHKYNWNVLGMTESHWYGGVPGRTIPGYKLYHTQRSAPMKKGGGLVLMVKQDLASYVYDMPSSITDAAPHLKSEILWVILPGKNSNIALGLTYLP